MGVSEAFSNFLQVTEFGGGHGSEKLAQTDDQELAPATNGTNGGGEGFVRLAERPTKLEAVQLTEVSYGRLDR